MVHFGRFVLSDHVTVILFFISLNFLLLSAVEAGEFAVIIFAVFNIFTVVAAACTAACTAAGTNAEEAVAAGDDIAGVAGAEGNFLFFS